MIERKQSCPICGFNIIAKVDNNIYCLNPKQCTWTTAVRREEDKQLPDIHEIKNMWGD